MQCGTPIVPVWAFGQTRAYSWIRPGPPLVPSWLVARMSRVLGAVPILIYGAYGTSMPHRERVTVVVGRPIAVQQMDEPPKEVLLELLRQFMDELQVRVTSAGPWVSGEGVPSLHILMISASIGPFSTAFLFLFRLFDC